MRVRLLIILLFILGAGAVGVLFTWLAGPGQRDPVPRLLLLAEEAILEGNLEGARTLLERAVEEDPENSTALSKLADIYAQGEDPAAASVMYRRAVESGVRDPDTLREAGVTALEAGKAEEARGFLEEAIAKNGSDAAAHYHLGVVLHIVGEQGGAETHLRRALELDQENPEILLVLGAFYEESGRPEEAIPLYRRSSELEPTLSVHLLRLGEALLDVGHPGEAEEPLRAALELAPGEVRARHALAHSLLRTGRAAAAGRQLRHVLETNPLYAPAHRDLGLLAHREGRRLDAIASLNRAMELEARDPLSRLYLGRLFLEEGQLEAARDSLAEAAALAPGMAEPRFLLGELHRRTGEPAIARDRYAEAFARDPRMRDALGGGALAALDQDDEEVAERLLAQAGDRSGSGPLRLAEARFRARRGETEAALRELEGARGEGSLRAEQIRECPDLDPLYRDRRFRQLIGSR